MVVTNFDPLEDVPDLLAPAVETQPEADGDDAGDAGDGAEGEAP